MYHTKHHADGLRNCSCKRRRPHAPMEHAYEQHVQHYVRKRGQQQIIKRPAAVAKRVHYAFACIIEHHGQYAHEIIAEISYRVRQHLRISTHPAEYMRRHDYTKARKEKAAHGADQNVRMYGALHPLLIVSAEIARNGDACAHGKAFKKLMSRNISGPDELTAASASSPKSDPR